MATFYCSKALFFFFLSLSLILCVQGVRYSQVSSTYYYRNVEADELNDWATANQCFEACGLTKYMGGITLDVLSDPRFTEKLCSTLCYHGCPNIAEHYFKLLAGEGMHLQETCRDPGRNAVRQMVEIGNRVWGAFGSMEKVAYAPTQFEEPLTGN